MSDRTENHLIIACLDAATDAALAMTGFAVVDAFAADPEAQATAKGPLWVKLAPRGAFTARDGRKFDVSPETLVERFNADGVAVAIDMDHATVKKAASGDPAPAIAWIEELEARADGLYGKPDWLPAGLEALAARSHRYISPALQTDANGRATWLHSAGLVAAPGISMPAVASAQPNTKETPMTKAIAAALGLQDDAAETSCLSAIGDLRQRIEPGVHQQTLATLAATQSELEALKTSIRNDKVHTLLEGALTAKKITPAQRETYEALCATEDGFKQVSKLIETLGAGLVSSGLDNKTAPGQVVTLSAEDRDIMKALGQSEEEFRKANGLLAA